MHNIFHTKKELLQFMKEFSVIFRFSDPNFGTAEEFIERLEDDELKFYKGIVYSVSGGKRKPLMTVPTRGSKKGELIFVELGELNTVFKNSYFYWSFVDTLIIEIEDNFYHIWKDYNGRMLPIKVKIALVETTIDCLYGVIDKSKFVVLGEDDLQFPETPIEEVTDVQSFKLPVTISLFDRAYLVVYIDREDNVKVLKNRGI